MKKIKSITSLHQFNTPISESSNNVDPNSKLGDIYYVH